MSNESTEAIDTREPASASDAPSAESPLVLVAGDEDLICVDDTCAPPEIRPQ